MNNKVQKYEEFVNERLKADLKRILDKRDKLQEEICEYLQVKQTIKNIKESHQLEDLRTQIDLGCNFFVKAKIPDCSRIFVKLSFGFFAELTLDEAENFIEKKVALLNETVEQYDRDGAKVKAYIRIVLESLRELQDISATDKPPQHQDIWY